MPVRLIRCGIVEDVPFQRRELERALGEHSSAIRFEIALTARDGVEAVEKLEALEEPLDIAFVDYMLDSRSHDGVWVAGEFTRIQPRIKICFVTDQYRYPDNLLAMSGLREASVFAKKDAYDDLVQHVAEIVDGAHYLSPSLAQEVQDLWASGVQAPPRLSPRQRHVVMCLAVGMTHEAAGRFLNMSKPGVRGHINTVATKLQCPPKAVPSVALETGALRKADLGDFRQRYAEEIERLLDR